MYRSTTSFTTKDYDVRPKQILEDDFTSEEQIQEFLRIGYIEVYDGTLEITENGQYDVEDYQNADVNVSGGEVNLQSKEVTITENGTTTITPDQGYDGLSDVDVTVNVPIPTPTLELYDVLEINHSIGSMFDTGYIANENTEVIVEYEDWLNYSEITNSMYLFGIRYGTKSSRMSTKISTSTAYALNSYAQGAFKFGNQEISANIMNYNRKTRLKLNATGIYEYINEDYSLLASFQTVPTWTTMQDNLILFGEKQILTITSASQHETYINYVNVVPLYMKFHFMEIYENGVLKAKYVPAKYGNEIGVYDTVAQKMLDRVVPLEVSNENN